MFREAKWSCVNEDVDFEIILKKNFITRNEMNYLKKL